MNLLSNLLSKGLTKVTATLALFLVVMGASTITWSLIIIAGDQTIATAPSTVKLESVMYDEEGKELILNIRTRGENRKDLKITLYRLSTGNLYKVTISEVLFKEVDSNLAVISLRFSDELLNGSYSLKLEVRNWILEYKFRI